MNGYLSSFCYLFRLKCHNSVKCVFYIWVDNRHIAMNDILYITNFTFTFCKKKINFHIIEFIVKSIWNKNINQR